MLPRRNVRLLLAGAMIVAAGWACGFGAAQSGAPAPAPTSEEMAAPAGPAATATAAAAVPITILPTQAAIQPTEPALPAPPPAIPESRRLTLEFPPNIRAGDSDLIRLTLEVDTLGNVTPTAETKGNTVKGQTVQIPNLYDTHDVIAEARLDLAGVDVSPGGDISEPLLPGQSVTFYWSVHPGSSGTYRGTVWLFLRFVDKATKQESRIPISAQTIEISTSDLLGMGGGLARTVGGVGSALGAVLGFPFADDLVKWLWRRLRHKA